MLLTLGLAPAVSLTASGPETLTLNDAIREALAHNDRMVDARDRLEQADLGVHLAQSEFKPKVVPNIQGSFGQSDVANQNYRVDVTQRFATGTALQAGIGASTAQIPSPITGDPDVRYYNADTTLSLSQSLLRGFGSNAAGRAGASARLQRDDADRQLERTEQDLALDVAVSYYRVVASRAMQQLSAKTLERARKLVDASQARQAAGLASQLDVLRAQQLASQADIQVSDADAATEDAHAQLTLLMGRPAEAVFEMTTEIPAPSLTTPLDEALTLALEKRSDLQSLVASASDSRHALDFARNQLLPQLDVNLLLTRRQTAPSFADSFRIGQFQFATFFTISMPVDRTAELVAFQNALIERDRRDRAIEALRRSITDDVKHAVRERDRLRRSVDVAATAVDIAQKEIDVAQFRYERGLSNNLELVDAESNLLAAESRHVAAEADSAVADLRFRALIGVFDPRRGV